MNARTWGFFLLAALLLAAGRPASALPMWARKYNVACRQCHTVAPSLNSFGEAFLANHFRFPGKERDKNKPLPIPVSVLADFSYEKFVNGPEFGPRFDTVYLATGDSFRTGKNPNYYGGYFLKALIGSDVGGQTGDLDQAFVALPFAGKRGQWSMSLGQTIPLKYQYNPINELFFSLPWAFDRGVTDFFPDFFYPSFRVDYFSNRGTGGSQGDYFTLMLPLDANMAFSRSAYLHGTNGLFAHYFRRWNGWSAGAYAWSNSGDFVLGGLATYDLSSRWRFIGGLTQQNDRFDHGLQFSLETNYFVNDRLALLNRVEAGSGPFNLTGIALGATWYPLKSPYLRLSGEHRQNTGDRATLIRATLQY